MMFCLYYLCEQIFSVRIFCLINGLLNEPKKGVGEKLYGRL